MQDFKASSKIHNLNSYSYNPSDYRFLSFGIAGAILFMEAERLDSEWSCFLFKPIPILSLIGWVIWNAGTWTKFRKMILVGLIFGLLGSIFF